MCYGGVKHQTTRNVIISWVYRSPGTDLKSFCDSLETIIGDTKSKKAMFICGLIIGVITHIMCDWRNDRGHCTLH